MFWFIYFAIFLVFLYLSNKFSNVHVILFCIMVFFFGQRWMTGEDFPGYLLYYLIDFKGVDFSFFIFQDFFKYSGLSFSTFVFSLYFLTLFLTYKFINKFKYASVIFVMFTITELAFIQLSQLKQSLAIPFILFSFYFFYTKKNWLAVLFYLASSTIHVAALFLLPLLLVSFPPKRNLIKFALLIICVLPVVNISQIIPVSFYFKFSHYLDSDYNQALSLFHYLKLYGVMIIFYFLYTSNTESSISKNSFAITGMLIYLCLYALSFQFAPFMRLSYFFRIFEVITLVSLALDSSYKQSLRHYVFPFYSVCFLAIAFLDPYNVSRYEFQLLNPIESRTEAELYLEIEKFYEE